MAKFNSVPHSKMFMVGGIVAGVVVSVLRVLSTDIPTVFSFLVPVIATASGYYWTKSYTTSDTSQNPTLTFRGRLSIIKRGSFAVVIAFVLASFVTNLLLMFFGIGLGRLRLGDLVVYGFLMLLLGMMVGIVLQLVVFIVFGLLGSYLTKATS